MKSADRECVELDEWQVGEIRSAIEEADRDDFACDAEVKDFFEAWRRSPS
ncbi:hypothetical protein [Nevskia sp.]|nr:hypothetical protein [Nevskia sp.]